jgi:hypothetical protein
MSKPIARVVFSVLIGLVLIAAISTSVQGGLGRKLLKTGANSAQAHVVSGLMTNLNHYRSSVSELESSAMQGDTYIKPAGKGHGCEDELRTSPND